jgi:hypothetical protein
VPGVRGLLCVCVCWCWCWCVCVVFVPCLCCAVLCCVAGHPSHVHTVQP